MRPSSHHFARIVAVAAALAVSACTMDKQSAPTSLIGPAGLGTSFFVTASPDRLPRDGASTSTIRVTARDEGGRPLGGRTVRLDASAGVLSANEVVTNANGEGSAQFTAPGSDPAISTVTITATPIGGSASDVFIPQTISIGLTTATAAPVPSFTSTPESPGQFDEVLFNATGTTYGGVACSTACTYAWDFGDGTTGTGLTASRRFQTQGLFRVTLTVTAPGGQTASTSSTVTVGAAAGITATITVSPTNPRIGDTVQFDGRASTVSDGSSIVEYSWDFGDTFGSENTGSGSTTTHVYGTARTYTVRLTVRDSRGRTATTTATVTVSAS